jgi:hypothetical protein
VLSILHVSELPGKSSWKDGKRERLEDCLNRFVAGLYVKAEGARSARLELGRRRREQQEEEQRRWEAARLAEEEEKRAKNFQSTLSNWRLARDTREFIEEVRSMVAAAECTINERGPLSELLTWAEAYAHKVDPLAPLEAELAQHVAKREQSAASIPAGNAPSAEQVSHGQ